MNDVTKSDLSCVRMHKLIEAKYFNQNRDCNGHQTKIFGLLKKFYDIHLCIQTLKGNVFERLGQKPNRPSI